MRKDFDKVLFERGSRGGKVKNRSERRKFKEDFLRNYGTDSPKRQAMGIKRDWDSYKQPDIRYKPIRRFLQKNAGRPWNDVWSEICEKFKGNSFVNNELKEAIKFEADPTGRWNNIHNFLTGIYVDSEGILRDHAPKKKYQWNRKKEISDTEYLMVDGIWYEFRFRDSNDMEHTFEFSYAPLIEDAILISKADYKAFAERFNLKNCGKTCIYKKQMNTKEIKRMNNERSQRL